MGRKYGAARRLATSLGLKAAKVGERHREWRLRDGAAEPHEPTSSRVRIDFEELERPFQIVTRPFSRPGASCDG